MRKEKYIKVKTYKGNTYFTVQFQYGKGIKHTYSKTFNSADYDSPVQALNAACEHRDIKRGELATQGLPTRKMTVNEAYEESKKVYKRSENTDEQHDITYNKYIKPKYGHMNVADIEEWTIMSHLESMRYSSTDVVIKHVLLLWRKICKTAKGLKAVTMIATDTIEPPASAVHKEQARQDYTDEEMHKVIKALLAKPLHSNEQWAYNRSIVASMIIVSRYTGLRPRELRGLRREDIDFENGMLHIRPNKTGNIKTKFSIRSVPMNSIVRGELLRLCSFSQHDYLFSFYGGILPSSGVISQTICRAAKEAGVPGFHLYSMRHSFDSELITSGVDPRTVMELMGHNNVQTTIGTYARSTEEKRREAVELVENGRKMS